MAVQEKENLVLKMISEEIETKHNCKVVTISFAQLLSLCVRVKIRFNDTFIYRPFGDGLPTPEIIDFEDRTITFVRRIDLYDCLKQGIEFN